ncbi:ATP-grasp domain-containing protein [Planomonospora parontospora]|uniref:ATP-grasp domain-containing protein n=1 Tax=Planomonospora parontospora TaxID=58119 RepID=UPI001670388B|nr:ATP-grasp domain-containing protein [Planomonospora parontospora]GGL37751.1 argininosuccinate lyase [Planomonospora parontospora subsp. antibiotica]GII17545.1 argininosuccinate lyase [Planomonospora parontospora subsp. antibiotica]
MAHLLVIESWVGAMSTLLPRAIRDAGHRFTFLTRDLHHYLRSAPSTRPHPLLAADNVLTAETNDLSALLSQVERLHDALGFDGVLSSCDYYLPAVAEVAAHLGLPGPSPEAVRRACRKDLARAALQGAGVPGPRFAAASSWEQAVEAAAGLGYPLVVKPVDLCAGMYVRKVRDPAELRTAFLALKEFPVNARGQRRTPVVLLEELLTGPEVSVETVSADGDVHVVGVTGKSLAGEPWFVESGHLFPAALDADLAGQVERTAVAAVQALGLDRGVAHTELRLTPDGPALIEVNPCPAGNQITGIDLPMAHARLAAGQQPDLTPADTGVRSAAIAFLLPEHAGRIAAVHGTDGLAAAPDAVDWSVKPAGHQAGEPTSNNHYLGHVMVTDTSGGGAGARAQELVAGLKVEYER